MRKLSKKLLQKSKDAFLLSLELYNKPTITYRTESFCIFYTNSWELLLKAKIYEQSGGKIGSIHYKKKRNQKRESLTIDDCLIKLFDNNNDPVRRNIEYISELRNESTHLVINELDPYHSRAFQVGVFNYITHLKDWFNINFDFELKPGLISLITDVDKIPNIDLLRSKYNKYDFQVILSWIRKYEELVKLGNNAALAVEYKISIVKNPKNADVVVSSGPTGAHGVTIVEKIRNPDDTHPYRQKEIIFEVQSRLSSGVKFSSYIFQAYLFIKGYKHDNSNVYYFKLKHGGAGQYSQRLVDELVQAVEANSKNINGWVSQYSQNLKQRRKNK